MINKVVLLKYNGVKCRRQATAGIVTKMRSAARTVNRMIKAAVSIPFPPASKSGQFPHRRSGDFMKSIKYRTMPGDRGIEQFSDDPKAAWLEYGTRFMRPRPTFRKAAVMFKQEFESPFRRKGGTTQVSAVAGEE